MIAYNSTLTSTQVSDLYNFYSSVVLPIRWESFTGQVEAGQAGLKWTIENSSGNNHFEVERSTTGSNFSNIGNISAAEGVPAGSGSLGYSFIDSTPAKGANYYRIEETDADGSHSWTTILELMIASAPARVHLQQNPVSDELTLVNSGGITINRLQVVDVTGRVLLDQASNSSNSLVGLNTSRLKAGYYFLRVGESGNLFTIAFLKL